MEISISFSRATSLEPDCLEQPGRLSLPVIRQSEIIYILWLSFILKTPLNPKRIFSN